MTTQNTPGDGSHPDIPGSNDGPTIGPIAVGIYLAVPSPQVPGAPSLAAGGRARAEPPTQRSVEVDPRRRPEAAAAGAGAEKLVLGPTR